MHILATITLLSLAACSTPPEPYDETDTESMLLYDVGYQPPEIPHLLEPWGACGEAKSECDPGYTCVTMEPGLGICVKDTPCPDSALGGLPVVDDGAWCRIECEGDADCLPDYGLLCSDIGGCGWDGRSRA